MKSDAVLRGKVFVCEPQNTLKNQNERQNSGAENVKFAFNAGFVKVSEIDKKQRIHCSENPQTVDVSGVFLKTNRGQRKGEIKVQASVFRAFYEGEDFVKHQRYEQTGDKPKRCNQIQLMTRQKRHQQLVFQGYGHAVKFSDDGCNQSG